jgi:uncharacterized protein
MAGPLIVDTHVHLYRSAEEGKRGKVGYEIWEYGQREGVTFSELSGDLESCRKAMDAAGCSAVVVTNLLDVPRAGIPARDDLIAFNQWLCDIARADRRVIPLLAIDPRIMSIEDHVAHLRNMALHEGARGIKLHPPLQRLDFHDELLRPLFAACQELGMYVVSHSGPSRDGSGLGTPESFRPILAEFPTLRIVLAHMGGQAWRELPAIARDYPSTYFDLCEIVQWLGAERAPSPEEFVSLIRSVGVDRVMMGSDFPWYDIDRTVELVVQLPGLTSAEQAAILGENAARYFELPV